MLRELSWQIGSSDKKTSELHDSTKTVATAGSMLCKSAGLGPTCVVAQSRRSGVHRHSTGTGGASCLAAATGSTAGTASSENTSGAAGMLVTGKLKVCGA